MVYAGAAPGRHIPYLARLFPELKFFLVDPADFDVKPTERIIVRQDFFTEGTVKELQQTYKDEKIVFISDIRTGDPKIMEQQEVEEHVQKDMQMQMNWVLDLKPVASMLKFRLPWSDGSTKYLKGDIYLPVWGPQTTTETRLIVHGSDNGQLIEYDNRLYEEQMFYFNTTTRVQYYEHSFQIQGLDHCYDCAAELVILGNYFKKYCFLNDTELKEKIQTTVQDITKEISKGRTLATAVDVVSRKSWFNPRRYDVENRQVITYEKKRKREESESEELSKRRKRRRNSDDRYYYKRR